MIFFGFFFLFLTHDLAATHVWPHTQLDLHRPLLLKLICTHAAQPSTKHEAQPSVLNSSSQTFTPYSLTLIHSPTPSPPPSPSLCLSLPPYLSDRLLASSVPQPLASPRPGKAIITMSTANTMPVNIA